MIFQDELGSTAKASKSTGMRVECQSGVATTEISGPKIDFMHFHTLIIFS